MKVPAVSFVMPVRDGERWLAEACRSVLDQTFESLELIVIDDGSRDRTPAILAAISAADRRVRLQRQRANGLVAALNLGIELSKAPLIARLDADDIALPGRISRQVAYLAAHPRTVLLGTWADRIDARGRQSGHLKPETEPGRLAAMLETRNPFVHSTVMMRTQALRELGGYKAVCEAAEDYDLWLRLAERGEVAILPEALVRYRRHEAGVTQRSAVRQIFSMRLARRAARMRREVGTDPLAGQTEPPDWWADDVAARFYADDANFARFLSFAEQDAPHAERLRDLELPSLRALQPLSHAEKKLVRRAVINLLAIPRPRQLSAARLAALWGSVLLSRWI